MLLLLSAAMALLGCGGGRVYHAEFSDARGLVPGNDVRVDGAVAGRVRSIELTRRGTASVAFTSTEPPRADAVAAIRPVDLLGDNYLSLSTGRSKSLLHGSIPVARTSNSPRLDDLLRSFQPRVRDGMRALLVEGGLALDRRGADLGRAAVELRPALSAAQSLSGELASQNAALARLVPDASRTAGRIAAHERDLGPLVDGLAATLRGSADASGSLGPGVDRLPRLLTGVRATSERLAATASAAQPVVAQVAASAPSISQAVAGLPQLVTRSRSTAQQLQPAIRSTRSLLVSARPALDELSRALPVLHADAPAIGAAFAAFQQAAPAISKGFFVSFADQAAEPGNQPFDPFADPRRAYWRGAAVFSCEAFGVPVAPGCLDRVLTQQRSEFHLGTNKKKLPVKVPAVPKPKTPQAPRLPQPNVQPPSVPTPQISPQKLLGFLLNP